MWVAAFTSRASPAPETIVSLRWKYCAAGSWSQAQAPEQAKAGCNRCRTDDASDFHGHIPQFLAEIGGAEIAGKADPLRIMCPYGPWISPPLVM